MRRFSLSVGRESKRNVRGDGNCFYQAIALAINGKSEENFGHVRDMCNEVMIQNLAISLYFLYVVTCKIVQNV